MNVHVPSREAPSRLSPYAASLCARYPLTPLHQEKTIYHISLDIEGSNLSFSAGDAIGVYGQNDPILVQEWLELLQASESAVITHPRKKTSCLLLDYLTKEVNLFKLTSGFITALLPLAPDGPQKKFLAHLLEKENKKNLLVFLQEKEPSDILSLFPNTRFPLESVLKELSPLLPRFYSIASSPKYTKGKIDLTVAHLSYFKGNKQRFGIASHFLCHLAHPRGTPIPIYVQPTIHFTLPKDPTAPIIMIGPGTGIAPFRSFMQERSLETIKGPHWLFFGERHQETRFLYRDFWEDLKEQNLLKITTAFSRDQEHKIYVQHKLLEHRQEIWAWMQEGAHVYICGDADHMAKEVENGFLTIFETTGGLSKEQAKEFLVHLRQQKRYLLDVY